MSQASTKTDVVFQSSLRYKLIMSILAGVIVAYLMKFNFKTAGFGEFIGMFIGIWAGMYFGVISRKISLSNTELVLKTGLINSKKLPYSETSFRIEEKTGFASWAAALAPHSYMLFAKQNDKKEISIADTYGQEEFIRIIRTLEEKTGKVMDKPEILQNLL